MVHPPQTCFDFYPMPFLKPAYCLLIWLLWHSSAVAQITVPISELDPNAQFSGTVTAELLEGTDTRMHIRLTGRSDRLLRETDALLAKEVSKPFYWKRETRITGGDGAGLIRLKSRAGINFLIGHDTKNVHWTARARWDSKHQRAVLRYKVENIKGLGGAFEDLLRSWFDFMDGKVYWGVADSKLLASLSPDVLRIGTEPLPPKGLKIEIDLSIDRAAASAALADAVSDLGPAVLKLLMGAK